MVCRITKIPKFSPKFISLSLSLMETHFRKRSQNKPITTDADRSPQPPPPPMEEAEEEKEEAEHEDWFIKLVSIQADLIYNCLVSLISPIFSLMSMASESYHIAEEAKETVESAATKVPATISHGSAVLLRKLGVGFLGAAYVCMVLIMVMVFAGVVGVGLVQMWVEEPVFVRERLHFDYTDVHPTAVFSFGGGGGFGGEGGGIMKKKSRRFGGVPVGHTFYVSLVLLMPDSDFNRDIGVFQLSAELLSSNGDVIAKSSQPCMLPFRSLPIRLTRTIIMGVPLLLGISGETQKITVQILRHKEVNHPRTEAIRVTLIPRAGTSSLPQLYEAEILMNSQLPWKKELVHNWKWTIYVWATLYIYIMLLMVLVCCCRPLMFPMAAIAAAAASFNGRSGERGTFERESTTTGQVPKEPEGIRSVREDREISEALRKWQRNRSKRKAMFTHRVLLESLVGNGSAASSISITREDASVAADEDVGDSESVCLE